MSHIRFGVIIAAVLLSISGPVSLLNGISAGAAVAARAENAQTREYTPYELCCMAQYYYKRTSEDGFYPPEATHTEENDGTYTIGLRERVKDPDGTFHYATYAWYSVDAHGKGTDTLGGGDVDFTVYSKVYAPDELCKLAQDYYYRTNDFYPPGAEYTSNTDGTYTIHLYEDIQDEEGIVHSATSGWLTVNVCGIGQDDLTMQAVDINP